MTSRLAGQPTDYLAAPELQVGMQAGWQAGVEGASDVGRGARQKGKQVDGLVDRQGFAQRALPRPQQKAQSVSIWYNKKQVLAAK